MNLWKPELFEQLLKVQDIDLEIRILREKIQDIYRRLKEEDPVLGRLKRDTEEIEATISATESQRSMYSETLEDIRIAIKGLVTSKSGSPKPRTRSSTEALRIEEEKLTAMVAETEDQIKALGEERKRTLERIRARSNEMDHLQQGPEAELRNLNSKIAKLEKQRAHATAGLPPILMRRYDRLRKSSSGVSLTVIRDNVCSVCCMQMPTAVAARLSIGAPIHSCPACGRMVARVELSKEYAATLAQIRKQREAVAMVSEAAGAKKVPKKTVPKKPAAKKPVPKKTVPKKSATKKPTPKKIPARKPLSGKKSKKGRLAKKSAKKKAG